MSKCNGSCTKRRVGCRTDCPIWAQEEALKQERYARAQALRDVFYTAQNAVKSERTRTQAYKQGRSVR